MKASLGKVLYGFLFCAVLPALLLWWAVALQARLPALPPPPGLGPGWMLVAIGGGLIGWGMWDLWFRGGGVPMNAFPPPRHVAAGIYGWLAHPIYLGFSLLMPGVFAVVNLSAGFWIVAPAVWLGAVALVVGYERLDLQTRFGSLPSPRLALPPDAATPPRWWHRAAVYVLLLGPWLTAHRGVGQLWQGRPGWNSYLGFENEWEPEPAAAGLYASAFVWVAVAPLVAPSQRALRRFLREGWVGAGLTLWLHLVLPLQAAPRPGGAALPAVLGGLLPSDSAAAWGAVPSGFVFWVLLAAPLYAHRLPSTIVFPLAVILSTSAILAGRNSVAGVVAGAAIFLGVSRLEVWWHHLLRATEWVANSWRDWRIGGVRIINHGAYVALAAGGGLWLVGYLLGAGHDLPVLVVAGCSLLGAGIWAQWLESSSGLSRPFGYYGGIFGGWIGVLVVQFWRGEGWLMMGAFAVITPLVQGMGRLRCLVQGCCHGRPCADALGIRYRQPLSRVCKMTRWGGEPVYPTPLYSMLANIFILGLVLRLWLAGAELGFITGACLFLTACARFVEEGFRGEPQTIRCGGLAIYQWLALLFVVGGAVAMSVPTPVAPSVAGAAVSPLWYAVPFGLLVWFAMGVDFPESNRRFSRLA